MPVHSHGEVSHDHPDAPSGHSHDAEPVEPTAPPPEPPDAATWTGAGASAAGVATRTFLVRAALTVLGAAGIIGGAFLNWVVLQGRGGRGIEAPIRVFWGTTGLDRVGFASSAGLVVIVIGLVALAGLALPTGWLTRLAGALAIIAFVLFVITLYRIGAIPLTLANVGIGMWLILAGGILAVVGGFFGARPRPVATA